MSKEWVLFCECIQDVFISSDSFFFKLRYNWHITLCKFKVYNVLIWHIYILHYNSVQFSHSVVFDSLQPHEPQHARPPCPSPTLGIRPNPCLLCQWCHPTISSSVVPFSSCPQSPASESFQMSQLFTSGGQNIGVSASTSVLLMNTQDWSPLGWTGWILQSKGLWGPGNSLKNVFYSLFVVIIF